MQSGGSGSSGDGIDLAAVYQLLTEVATKVAAHDARFDRIDARLDGIDTRLDQHDGKFNELIAAVNDHTRKIDVLTSIINDHTRKLDDLAAGLDELRSTVNDYHQAVVGHGITITEHGRRIARIEAHLRLDPLPDRG